MGKHKPAGREERVDELEALVIELGYAAFRPGQREASAVAKLAAKCAELECHNALLREVVEVAVDIEPHLARLFGKPLLCAIDAAREGGVL